MNIFEAWQDLLLFGRWFSRSPETWAAWRVFLKVLSVCQLSADELAVFEGCTARKGQPAEAVREAWLIVGRRGGKSLIGALVAVFLACFKDYSALLAPGERGTLTVIAADRRQARNVMRYILGFLNEIPMLAAMVERRTAEAIDLNNRVTLEIHSASFRSIRGYTLVGAICDEIAFWRSEDSANPDHEILAALRPGLATVPGALLLCLSSPYARKGALWEAHKKHFGKEGPVLVWQASTRTMNPSVPESVIADEYERDPSSAAAEWGAEFRRDVETFVDLEAVNAVVVPGRLELSYIPGLRYHAFVDPSGGSQDSMTLAIAHFQKDGKVVLDAVREERPPFSPEQVVARFAELLKIFGVSQVVGDFYGGMWPGEQFRKQGIHYKVAESSKSDIYRDLLPLINSGRVELLDNKRLLAQLCNLERRTSRSGKDSIDHSPHSHDDLINAAAGALVTAAPPGRPARLLKIVGF